MLRGIPRTAGAYMLGGIALLVVLFIASRLVSEPLTHIAGPVIVTLTEQGFEPADISVARGTTVTFITTDTKEFWPASNQHPSHGEYPDFDPGRPLAATESWSFTFDRVGVWNFHNHLNARERGTVTVQGKDGGTTEECLNRGEGERMDIQAKCWEGEFKEAISEGGIDAAFALFNEKLSSDRLFAANCHDVMHIVGDAAYESYAREATLFDGSETSACGYGFYHGFIERMLRERGDYAESRAYCASIATRTDIGSRSMAYNAAAGCRHGIGHAVIDSLPGSLWGDGPLMAGIGTHQCELIFDDERDRISCASGISNALAIAYNNAYYDLSFADGDHFDTCAAMAEIYQPSCYQEMAVHYANAQDLSSRAAVELFTNVIPRQSLPLVTQGYASHLMQRSDNNDATLAQMRDFCKTYTDAELRSRCMLGVHGGIKKSAPPSEFTERSRFFCELFAEGDKTVCSERMIEALRTALSTDAMANFCTDVTAQFGTACKP